MGYKKMDDKEKNIYVKMIKKKKKKKKKEKGVK